MADELHHTPAKIIQRLLIAAGQGIEPSATTGDWKIFAHTETEKNDQAIFIYNTTGIQDGRIQRTGEAVEHPGIMIHVRALDSEVAGAKIRSVMDYLAKGVKQTSIMVETSTYLVWCFTRTSGPFPLGQQDKNRRFTYSGNGTITIEEI